MLILFCMKEFDNAIKTVSHSITSFGMILYVICLHYLFARLVAVESASTRPFIMPKCEKEAKKHTKLSAIYFLLSQSCNMPFFMIRLEYAATITPKLPCHDCRCIRYFIRGHAKRCQSADEQLNLDLAVFLLQQVFHYSGVISKVI